MASESYQSCPCGSGHIYSECCEPLHQMNEQAQTAEALMRSRYSAFVLKNADYLLKTLHPDYHTEHERESLVALFNETTWLGLKVIKHVPKGLSAEVEFSAFYQDNDHVSQLHERSRFIKIDTQWYYMDGTFLPPLTLARNEVCFCGSGTKFKRCHGR